MISEEEPTGPLIEQTDSGENHYILNTLAVCLHGIHTEIAGIRTLLEASYNASQLLQQQAQEALEAHKQNTQDYLSRITTEPAPDFYPFVDMPTGTNIRDLPDGNRLFTLSDGVILKTNADHTLAVIVDGEARQVIPDNGAWVEITPGQAFELQGDWIKTTAAQAGIEGLPSTAHVSQLAENRFSIELPPYRLLLDQSAQALSVINPSGTIDLLGLESISSVGAESSMRVLPDGSKGFTCADSGHGGLIENDGTIRLSLKSGIDLIIRFPHGDAEVLPDSEKERFCER
ncbi:hypothetical protein EGM51_01130 [Verrucomicrobia bacterium S94]|nr:hypothetical protein EGM51_01130 [Verrucomicrobia bacterium S94]